MHYSLIKVFCDGGSRGNPGPAASGVVFLNNEDQVIAEFNQYIGIDTNNQAEYQAVVLAITKLAEYKFNHVKFYLDSELIVKQLNGIYRIKNLELKPHYLKIISWLKEHPTTTVEHVRRELNKLADAQVNICLDDIAMNTNI